MDALLHYPAFIAAAPTVGLTNSIMGSVPQHPFFLQAILSLRSYDRNWFMPYLTIMNSTGPHFISFVWALYLRLHGTMIADSDRIRLIMSPERQGNPWSIWYSTRGKSWHNWDNVGFVFVHQHVKLVIVLLMIAVCGATVVSWLFIWRLFFVVRSLLSNRRRLEVWPIWMTQKTLKDSRLEC